MPNVFKGIKIDKNGVIYEPIITFNSRSYVSRYPCSSIYDCYPLKITLQPGIYKFECWGAEGGTHDSENYGGRGAYTSGILHLHEKQTFYFYVGESGQTVTGEIKVLPPTFNGGGSGGIQTSTSGLTHYGSSGGGATDVRTIAGLWYNETSLKSRIMVAAGGGASTTNGPPNQTCRGGYGGAPIGGIGEKTGTQDNIEDATGGETYTYGKGGVGQRSSGEDGDLGVGGNGGNSHSTSGGGGGYYGGGGSGVSGYNHQCGAGGSSYISGYKDQPQQSLIFQHPIMNSGNDLITRHTGELSRGNKGNGHIRITILQVGTKIKILSFNIIFKAIFLSLFLSDHI